MLLVSNSPHQQAAESANRQRNKFHEVPFKLLSLLFTSQTRNPKAVWEEAALL